MTTETQTPMIDLRSEHDKMRRLFERFSQATGDDKKAIARELMDRLMIRPPQ